MSENKIRKIEITAFIAACILGVLFHFVYDWTGKNPAAAAFFPVNESTWEHLKLVFFPIMILSLGEYFSCSRHRENGSGRQSWPPR